MIFLLEKAYFIANMSGLAWSCRPVLTLQSTLSMKLVQGEESFQIMPGFIQGDWWKRQKKKNTRPHFLLFIFNTTFLITYSKRKRKERKEGKVEDRKIKGNVKTAVTLFNPKDISKFCFLCICNLLKLTFASGMEGCKVLDLWIVFRVVLAFNSQTMTGGFFLCRGGGWGAKLSGANYGVFIRPQVLFLPWRWNLISERFWQFYFFTSFCIHFRRTKCKIVSFFVYPCRLG